jgi:sulfonate transport system substrate-binding protein
MPDGAGRSGGRRDPRPSRPSAGPGGDDHEETTMSRFGNFLKRAVVIAAAIGVFGAAEAADVPDLSRVTINVAYYKGLHKTLLEAAGLANTPYRIEWKEFNSGVQHIEGINAGSLDFGSGSEIPPVFAAQANARVKIIAVYHEDANNQGLFVQGKSDIRTVADLKGKRVGYTRGTTSHYYLYKMLKEAGLSFDDIQATPISPQDGLSAFAKGDLDAWAVWGYNGQIARQQLGARTLKTAVAYLSGNWLIYGSPDALADPGKKAAVGDLLVRLQRAYAWSNRNYPAYAEAQSKETRVKVSDIQELFDTRSQNYSIEANFDAAIKSHQDVADTFLALKLLDKPVDVSKLWDRTYDDLLKRSRAKLEAEGIW